MGKVIGTRRVAIDDACQLESIIQVIPKLFDGLSTIADLDARRLDMGLPGSKVVPNTNSKQFQPTAYLYSLTET